MSSTVCRIEPGRATVDLRFQTASLLESLPLLDADLDGRFTDAELADARPQIGEYLLANWRLLQPAFTAEDALTGDLASLTFATDLRDLDASFQWIDARLELRGEGPLEDLVVHSELFTERDPYHRDFLTLTYGDESSWQVLFRAGEHRWRFRSARLRAPEVRSEFFRSGLSVVVWELELALFLLALIAVARGVRHAFSGLGLIGAGLVVGSAWASFGPAPPERFVFLATPLALAYIGAENLLRRTARTPWVEAPLFGVLLALSAAASHSQALELEPLATSAVFGLEAAVLVTTLGVALPAIAVARFVPGDRTRTETGERGLAAGWFALAVSVATVLTGFGLFLWRTGWFS